MPIKRREQQLPLDLSPADRAVIQQLAAAKARRNQAALSVEPVKRAWPFAERRGQSGMGML